MADNDNNPRLAALMKLVDVRIRILAAQIAGIDDMIASLDSADFYAAYSAAEALLADAVSLGADAKTIRDENTNIWTDY